MYHFFQKQDQQSGKGIGDTAITSAISALFFVAVFAIFYFSIFGNPPLKVAEVAKKVSLSLSQIDSYTAQIRIDPSQEFFLPESINGTMLFDVKNNESAGSFDIPSFVASSSPRIHMQIFTSEDKTLVDLKTTDTGAANFIPFPSSWFILSPQEKPEQYRMVDNSGTLLDIIRILKREGGNIMIVGAPLRETNNGISEIHLVVKLPKDVSEILAEKNVDLFVDAKSYRILKISFHAQNLSLNADITGLNDPLDIVSPANALSYEKWKGELFSESVAQILPISQIFIGSYGSINPKYLEGIRVAVEKATGVKTILLTPATTLPKKAPIYNADRQAWNADALLKSLQALSSPYGQNVRILYVINEKMYNPIDALHTFSWNRGNFESNAAIVSLFELDSPSTPLSLIVSRAQKVVLSALGATVGFDFSPGTLDQKCVTYPAQTLIELDKQGVEYCSPEKGMIPKIFKK